MPREFGQLSKFEVLELSSNCLNDYLHWEIGASKQFHFLDLVFNLLNDSIQSLALNMDIVEHLILQWNQMTKNILEAFSEILEETSWEVQFLLHLRTLKIY
jgi:hypothetical protein